jgi:soluble lytic murein transglycosylase-like protein
MDHATDTDRQPAKSGDLIVRLTHAKLFTAGLVAAAWLGVTHLQHEPVGFADTGLLDAETAAVELPVPEAVPMARNVDLLSTEMKRVRDYVAKRYKVPTASLDPVLAAAEHRGRSSGIDPMLIVAVMAIESSFNPLAVSSMGAQGLMQVIPRFHMDKLGADRRKDALFDPLLNVRVGTEVLVEGLRRFGSMESALQYYGGALDDPNTAYANKVLAMKRRLVSAASRGASAGTDV